MLNSDIKCAFHKSIIAKIANRQVLLTSGLFIDKESALRKIDTTRHLAGNSRNYELCTAEADSSYFFVKTAKGEALVYSAFYPDAESLQITIHLAKSNTRGARLEDLTQDPAYYQEKPTPSGRLAAVHARNHESLPTPVSTQEEAGKTVSGALI